MDDDTLDDRILNSSRSVTGDWYRERAARLAAAILWDPSTSPATSTRDNATANRVWMVNAVTPVCPATTGFPRTAANVSPT